MPVQHETIQIHSQQSFRLLQWEDNLREVQHVLGPGHRESVRGAGDHWHYHPEMELMIAQHGRGTRFVGDHIGPFTSLDVVLIGPNVPHFWKGLRGASGYVIQWRFQEEHPFWKLPETAGLERLWRQAAHGLRFSGATAEAALSMVSRMMESRDCGRLALFFSLLDTLAQAPLEHTARLSSRSFDLSALHAHQPAIERVIRHIIQNYRESLELPQVLKLSGMSKATFARQFRKHAGKPFSSFVNQVRLDSVCRDLVGTHVSVSEAAFANGFNSLSYFNRAFLKAHGCRPKEYRQRALEPAKGES